MSMDGGNAFHYLTLRDYFATAALPECIASYDRSAAKESAPVASFFDSANLIAKAAYIVADAMLKERDRE